MPKYLFSLFDDESLYDYSDESAILDEMKLHEAFAAAVEAAGGRVLASEALEPSSTATVVRRGSIAGEGDPLVSDGPFIETKEALGGFYVIEAADLDQALELAKHCPAANVEVRPVWDLPTE